MHEYTVTHSKVYLKCVHVNEQNQIQTPSGFYLSSTKGFMQFLSVYMKIYVLAWDLNKKKQL